VPPFAILEHALVLADGAGERSALVLEQLARGATR
jgi:hypothetical protein